MNGYTMGQTSVSQYYLSLENRPSEEAESFLCLDLDVCLRCERCSAECSYPLHDNNQGILSLIEWALFELVCRRCAHPHCVDACPTQALSKDPESGRIRRLNVRCVHCQSCTHACPYGTILSETMLPPVHNCDYCAQRPRESDAFPCIETCPEGALTLCSAEGKTDENTFPVGRRILVHSHHWKHENA